MLKSIQKITKTYTLQSNTKILKYKNSLIAIGQKGRIIYKMNRKEEKTILTLKNQSLEIVEKRGEELNTSIFGAFQKILNGVNNSYSTKLNLIGIGFRSWVYFNSKHQQILIIKIDLSKDLKFIIPKSVTIFCLTPTLIFIHGVKKDDVKQLALKIKSTKKIDSYKGKGIFFEGEKKRLKVGKKI